MSIRFTSKARRGMVALAVAAGLALGVAGCGSVAATTRSRTLGVGLQERWIRSECSGRAVGRALGRTQGLERPGPGHHLRQRDSGGFVTVNGNLKNDGDKSPSIPAALSGNETEIIRNGPSFGGATLVDSKGKKRYYVLRDTDGRPLTTTGFSTLKAGDDLAVFMQFPAPPSTTTEVSFELPTFSVGTIKISG
jgi:hypothetical protein